MKTQTIADLAGKWGVTELTARRRLKAHKAKPSGTGANGKLQFPAREVKRVEAAHVAAVKQKLNSFAEAA